MLTAPSSDSAQQIRTTFVPGFEVEESLCPDAAVISILCQPGFRGSEVHDINASTFVERGEEVF